MLILIKPSISLYDAGNSVRKMHYCLGAKMKSPFNQRCRFLLFMLAIKTCSIEANTTLAFERGATGQNWVPFLFDIHGLNSIFRGKNGCIAAYFIIFLPNWIFPADWRVCFQVLVVLFLPNVQTWMRTVYTQDLTPFWNTIHTYTYKYSLLAIQLLSPKTKTCIINRCLKWLMFLTIQCINLPKIALPQRPGLQRNMYAYTYLSWMAAPIGPTTEFETYKMICLRGACQVDR